MYYGSFKAKAVVAIGSCTSGLSPFYDRYTRPLLCIAAKTALQQCFDYKIEEFYRRGIHLLPDKGQVAILRMVIALIHRFLAFCVLNVSVFAKKRVKLLRSLNTYCLRHG